MHPGRAGAGHRDDVAAGCNGGAEAMTAGLAGTTLGRYEVGDEIGQGGMSVVYCAHDTQLKRDVAIKVMHSFLAEQEEARERFHREAVAVARLRHPHIIEIFDYSGEQAKTAYIVMELVKGRSLAALLSETAIEPPEAALLMARPILDALAHAHAEGIIHRDLKPENILVGSDGTLKLTDFGIARMLDTKTLTMTGTLLGSPAYMAPEYIEGHPTDARADIFSFGAMLYQLAVGGLPFEATSPHALLKKIAGCEFAPPDQANPEVHGQIARILRKCLARLPEQRYETATDLLAEVDALLARLDIDHRTELPKLLVDPEAYGKELGQRLGAEYLDLGKAYLEAGSPGQALEDFDRVLSLDPGNNEVRRILDRLARRASVRRFVRAALLGVVGSVPVTLIVASVIQLATGPEKPLFPPDVPEPLVANRLLDVPQAPTSRDVTFALTGVGDLWIDDTLVKSKVHGLETISMLPGEHAIRFAGRKRTDERVVVVPKEGEGDVQPVELDVRVKRRPVKLPPKVREVEFNSPRWVNVYVDGGTKPVLEEVGGKFALQLTHGKHTLRFENKYGEPEIMPLNVTATTPSRRITVRIKPKPAWLRIVGAPDGAFVEIAEQKRPINEFTRDDEIIVPLDDLGPLESSVEHDVVVRMVGHREFRKRVTFRPGEHKEVQVRLEPL
jgi:serine/threonine protein kinase